jgi:hypothetical protein
MYQFDNQNKISPLLALRHILDVTCSLLYAAPTQTLPKLKAMQTMMDDVFKENDTWNTPIFSIPINTAQGDTHIASRDTRGILGISKDGKDELIINFLDRVDTFLLM